MQPAGRWATYAAGGAAVAFMAIPCEQVWAGNGFGLIGTGAESIGMGGADVAVTHDTSALLINPAALTRIADTHLDLTLYPYANGYRHADELGNDDASKPPFGVVVGGGYAQRLQSLPEVVLGVGLNVQGGSGFDYENLQTPFSEAPDELSSIFGVTRLAFGGAWQANDRLSLGLVGGVSYASARQKFLPETSNAEAQFFGFRFDSGETVQLNVAAGLLYTPTPAWRLGLSYSSRIKLPLSGGTLTVNYDAIDLGRVRYREARFDGLSLPQELSAGFAWTVTPRWLVAADVKWLDWSVIKSSRLSASQPANPDAPAFDPLSSPVNLRDQYVLAIGFSYQYDEKTSLRAGVNLGRNPVPDENLSPLLNVTETHEFDFGFGRRLGEHWQLDGALQIIPPQKTSYTNPQSPFGRSSETFEAYALLLTAGRSW